MVKHNKKVNDDNNLNIKKVLHPYLIYCRNWLCVLRLIIHLICRHI
jgi:hypothetical protein